MPAHQVCVRCGYMSSNKFCKACVLLESLNKGKPALELGEDEVDADSKPSKKLLVGKHGDGGGTDDF